MISGEITIIIAIDIQKLKLVLITFRIIKDLINVHILQILTDPWCSFDYCDTQVHPEHDLKIEKLLLNLLIIDIHKTCGLMSTLMTL